MDGRDFGDGGGDFDGDSSDFGCAFAVACSVSGIEGSDFSAGSDIRVSRRDVGVEGGDFDAKESPQAFSEADDGFSVPIPGVN